MDASISHTCYTVHETQYQCTTVFTLIYCTVCRYTVYTVLYVGIQYILYCMSVYSIHCTVCRYTVYTVLYVGIQYILYCMSVYSIYCTVYRHTVQYILYTDIQYSIYCIPTYSTVYKRKYSSTLVLSFMYCITCVAYTRIHMYLCASTPSLKAELH